MFVTCHGGIDGTIGLADERAMIGVRTFRAVSRRHGYAKRAASLATYVVDQYAAAIIH